MTVRRVSAAKCSHLVGHLRGEPGPGVEHGQQHGAQLEVVVQLPLDQIDGPHQLGDALQGVVLALDGNQDLVAATRAFRVSRPSDGGQSKKT